MNIHEKRVTGHIDFDFFDEGVVEANHHKEYYNAIMQAMAISAKKNHDYAGGMWSHPLANFKKAEDMGLTAEQGLWMRALDKVGRINTFFKEGKLAVESESVEDAFMDLGNYCFLMIALLRDNENGKL